MRERHLIDLEHYDRQEWEELLELAEKIYANPLWYSSALHGKIMATLFYEPSTRTQMSFQAAMMRLGGQVIGFENPLSSSISKGENLKDTIKIISGYSDILVIRHPMEGAARAAAQFSDCPVVNAGDGGHLHPTQTLTDLMTLRREKGRLDHLKIAFCGDLKYGRTIHSLIKALSHYPDNFFYLISSEELKLPAYLTDQVADKFREVRTMEECLGDVDVLYMSRIQRERFETQEAYDRQKGSYILNLDKMQILSSDCIIMHPLPRVEEIDIRVDDDDRAKYFDQARYGMYIRIALILKMVEGAKRRFRDEKKPARGNIRRCFNSKCITNQEHCVQPETIQKETGIYCAYCEQKLSD